MPLKTSIAQAIRAFCLALLLIPLALIAPAGAQAPQPRLALVLGNAEYRVGPLATSANDAGLIAETLRNAGFDVTGAANLDQDQTRRAFREFLEKASAAGPQAVVFVYLAGRGLQFEGENYFVPVEATIPRDSDVPAQAVRISDLTRPLAGTQLAARMFVLDLARANTFAQVPGAPGGQPLAPGLALVEPEDGSLIAFNAAPGTIAPEEQPPYGAYAQALSEMMRQGGLPVDEVFSRTRLRVNELTRGAVVPWHASKITVPFVFFDRAPGAPAPAVSVEQRAAIARRPIREFPADEAYGVVLERDTIPAYQEFLVAFPSSPQARRVRAILAARREALIWRRAVTANRPEAYWTYMRRYPRGPHFADARRRLVVISAPLEPPPQFAFYEYDVPPPPPEEVEFIETRRTYYFDDRDYGPPPPAPVMLLGPRERDYYPPPPPPPTSRGFLPIPLALPMPYARPVERQGGFAAPAFMAQPPQPPRGPAPQPAQAPGAAPQPAPGQPPRPGQPPAQPGAGAPAPQPLPGGKPLPPGAQPAPGTRPGGAGTPPPGSPPPATQPQPLPGARPPGGPAGPGAAPGAAPRPNEGVKPVSPPATRGPQTPPPAAAPKPAAPAAPAPAAAPKPAAPAPATPAPAAAPRPASPPAAAPKPAPAPSAAPPPAAAPRAAPPAAAPPHAAPPAAAPPRPAAPPAPAAPKPGPPPAPAAPHAAPPPAAAPRPAAPPPAAPRPAAPPPAAAPPRPAPPPPVAPKPPPPAAAAPRPAAPAAAAPTKPACGLPGLPPCH
jgi:uncharacterized caspase-like protein